MMKKKKVLITGVAGFVGSNLATELINRGYEVIGVDDLSHGSLRNIEIFLKHDLFHFVQGDVCNKSIIMEKAHDVDYIVHLAAFKIPRYGNALKTLMVNSKGTENILEISREQGCKVVFSSTSDIYGKNPSLPFSEESDLVLGQTRVKRWGYAVSKIFDEHLCFAYHEEFGVPLTIVRYFGGYGPGQHLSWRGGPQPVFIDCALRKQPLPIHGTGQQKRCFTYISDMVEGTIKAMESEAANGEVFNIGNSFEVSILTLATEIWNLIYPHEKPPIEFISYESFSGKYEDVMRRIPDMEKAKKILNFEAKIDLKEGLTQTIEWQKQVTTAVPKIS